MAKEVIVNLKNPEDSPQKIADKLNTLSFALDHSVIRGAVKREEFDDFKNKTTKYISGNQERIDNRDLRWHGSGLSKVIHDATLTGDGTLTSPLHAIESGGDVVGPTSATDTALAVYDGTTGKLLKNSKVDFADTGTNISLTSVGDESFTVQSGGDGYDLNLKASTGTTSGSFGGNVNIVAGKNSLIGNASGGDVNITAGDGNSGGGISNGGNVFLLPGGQNGGGTVGVIKERNPVTGKYAVHDLSLITSTDKTFTYPNTSGTLALTSQLTSGTVTNVSVVSANGMAGTVASASTTPAITLSTTVTGILKGNGTAISTATADVDYLTPTLASATFLTIATATGTYLPLSVATATYLPNSVATSIYLSQALATATYLSQAAATGTYLSLALATSAYLPKSLATATYLSISSATATYLSQALATSQYLSIPLATATYLPISVATATYLSTALATATYLPLSVATATYMPTSVYDTAAIKQQLVGITATQTLTNKRISPRWASGTSATPTINTDTTDIYLMPVQNVAITSVTASGTPTEGQKLWWSITGTGAVALTLATSVFEASTVALPTTTVTTARLDLGFVYNTVTGKWRIVAQA